MRRSLCAALAILAGATSPASAFELFGIHLFGDRPAEEETIGDPQPYAIEFTVAGEESEKALKGASRLWSEQDKPASGSAGLVAMARDDYRRLLAALYAEGRYGGTISITIDGREAADLAPDAALAGTADVRVAIAPGPAFLLRNARILNPAPPPADPDDLVEDPAAAGFRPGEVARSGTILRAERLAVDAWRHQGHAKAAVAERRVRAAHRDTAVDAEIEIAPGRRAVYGATDVTGAERMDPAFVAFMAGLPPGTEYDPDDLERAGKRLARLDVFRSMRIEEAAEIGSDGVLPIGVVVQERALRRIGLGGSYSSVDGLGIEAFWLHRNLFGRAERLRLEARVAGINGVDPDEFTYRIGATFLKPGIYTPDTDFVASVQGEREVLEPYTRTGVRAEAGITHQFTEELSARLLAKGDHARFEDMLFGRRDFSHAGFLGGVALDTRDDPRDATQGFLVEIVAEPFYEFNFGNAAARVTTEGRAYYGFGGKNRLVAAGRLKLGALWGSPIAQTAPDRLFFAGGGGSVRGYAYRNIGVEMPGGLISGGRSLVEASAELRLRVTDTIGVVGFVDAGHVGADPFPDFSEPVRVGAGIGLRYVTGFGPIRVDVAVPLDPRPGDPDVALYVGIGQSF